VEEEEGEENLPVDASPEIMTFDIEVASNNGCNRLDTGRDASDIGGLDSRRSLSEIHNEGDLAGMQREELTIHNKV